MNPVDSLNLSRCFLNLYDERVGDLQEKLSRNTLQHGKTPFFSIAIGTVPGGIFNLWTFIKGLRRTEEQPSSHPDTVFAALMYIWKQVVLYALSTTASFDFDFRYCKLVVIQCLSDIFTKLATILDADGANSVCSHSAPVVDTYPLNNELA